MQQAELYFPLVDPRQIGLMAAPIPYSASDPLIGPLRVDKAQSGDFCVARAFARARRRFAGQAVVLNQNWPRVPGIRDLLGDPRDRLLAPLSRFFPPYILTDSSFLVRRQIPVLPAQICLQDILLRGRPTHLRVRPGPLLHADAGRLRSPTPIRGH